MTSLGWFRINLDKYFESDVEEPDYLFMAHETFFSMGLKIGENETDEEAEMRISKRIFDYSLSQTREIDCNEVENGSNDKFIYFGDR